MSYQSSLQPISCSLSLSSCRLKAEAIARALNNRIWPTALINDCDDHSSDDDALQVTRGACGARPTSVIDRPPQAHDIYDGSEKIIGHCWLNGMQTDDDDEYFDTPPCSSPPSPAEEEIIVNPPTHNGISPFFTEYRYEQHEAQHSDEMPSFTGYSDNDRLASGTKLFEKLQRYSETLSQNEEGTETFYDVSDYEDYEEEQVTNAPEVGECDRSINKDLAQPTELNAVADLENEVVNSSTMALPREDIDNSDPPACLSDINIAITSSEVRENLATAGKVNCRETDDEGESSGIAITDSVPEEVTDGVGASHSNYISRRKTEFTKPVDVNTTVECYQDYPDIGIVPASPLQNSTSSNSESDLQTEKPAAVSSSHSNFAVDFHLRRIQELEEEERPKLLRTTSLKTGKTPPGTPGRKKFVRFADALGLDLEDVRHIVQDDLPNVPSSAYTDLNIPEPEDKRDDVSRSEERVTFPGGLWDPAAMPGAGSGAQSLIPQFQAPSTKPDFSDRVRCQYVCLENIVVSDLTLHCTCRVLNVAYEKFVAARYTTNEWQTSEEVVASFVPNSSDGVFDKFAFSLFLRYLLPHQRLLFAIRYVVGGTEYWDNNFGENYVLRCHSNAPALPSTECGSSWMHHFY